MTKNDERQELIENFMEAITLLSNKEKDDIDFQLMKKAVASIWANIPEEDDDS